MKNLRWALLGCVVLLSCVTSLALPSLASAASTKASGTIPLLASNVQALNITMSTANISWQTNGNSNSSVFYDTTSHSDTSGYPHSASDSALVSNHNVQLTGLIADTTYYFMVESVATIGSTQLTAVSSVYTFTTLPPQLVIVMAIPQTKVYGTSDPTLTYTSNITTVTFTGALTRAGGENDGTYVINEGNLSAGPNYNIVYTGATLTISPASLTVTANATSKVYGASDPALTYNTSGFVNGDTSGIMTGSLLRALGQTVGSYAINQGNLSAGPNYNIVYTGATLTISPASLTVTANAKSKVYGTADPALTYNASGFVNGDTSSIMTGSLSRALGQTVGSYAINQGTLSAGGNYNISFTGANLTIIRASLTITANNASKTYGNVLALPSTGFKTSGLVSGDSVTGVTLTSAGTAANAVVGLYNIVPSAAVGTGLNNYTITYVNGTLTVGSASLTVTAAAKSKVYGASDPPLTYVATGFVNGDTSSILTGSLSRALGENVGNYSITVGTLKAGNNYTIKFVSANLSITKANTNTTVTSSKPVCLLIALLVGCQVTFTANVAPAPPLSLSGLTGPTGTVTFYDGKANLGTGTLSSSGTASVRTCPLIVIIYALFCNHTITAVYSGDGNFNPSSSPAMTEMIPW